MAVLSPGPAILAIISTAVSQGRRAGLFLSFGVYCGSFFWAMAASFGLAALLGRYGEILSLLKVAGGFYLLYLAFRSGRSVVQARPVDLRSSAPIPVQAMSKIFVRGFLIHLTNPKAVFAWLSVITLGLPPEASVFDLTRIVTACLITGFIILNGYAVLFSTERAYRVYRAARRWIDGVMASLFAVAGIKMLLSM
ncbi:LysE family translocator [Allorhizobium sp. BGMRC 0089]|uniref:LysE family translocator n=1 Tax=Allorhizobium sonneratiae TaxID=2934936 RepID=UPI002033F910|nr:LysE family translocator [Allorhizobium sonneratiae]